MNKLVLLLVLAVAVQSAPCYKHKYKTKWPHCKNIRCMRGSLSAFQKACSKDKRCNGFSFSSKAGGCLKQQCAANQEAKRGYGSKSHGYFAKTPCLGRKCAREHLPKGGNVCKCRGTVAYGAKGEFKYKKVNGKITCNNKNFGDPISGVVKDCFCKPAPVKRPVYRGRKCAREHARKGGNVCKCRGTVSYGARGKFRAKRVNGKITCNNRSFGDPIHGVVKDCFCKPAPVKRTRCYKHKYKTKWPHCKNIKCMRGSLSAFQRACSKYKNCNGFSFSKTAGGCLKQKCAAGKQEASKGYGRKSHGYYAKSLCTKARCGKLCQHYRRVAKSTHRRAAFYKNEQKKYAKAARSAAARSRSHSKAAASNLKKGYSHARARNAHLRNYRTHSKTASRHHANAARYKKYAKAHKNAAARNKKTAAAHLRHMSNYYKRAHGHTKQALKHLRSYRSHSSHAARNTRLGSRYKKTAQYHKKQATLAYKRYKASVAAARAHAAAAKKYYARICATFRSFMRRYGHYFQTFYTWDRSALRHERTSSAHWRNAARHIAHLRRSKKYHALYTKYSAQAYARARSHRRSASNHLRSSRSHSRSARSNKARGNSHKSSARRYQQSARSHTGKASRYTRMSASSKRAGNTSRRHASNSLRSYRHHARKSSAHIRAYHTHRRLASRHSSTSRSHSQRARSHGRTSAVLKSRARGYDRLAAHYHKHGKF